ncbi:hypothetical protein Pan44_09530 [Caulifigura coniformis]|uniref:Uncharacterized protein n=1 Tax=Caulifigura coniformis TaxID=2527983 RepID=A0A517S9Y3_9PLAN|nr:hypothetical protein [Caulifigura coniformis]QDT52940.1 hypothetical protein Pan44_09530 [Caulifigura coniformis]
MTFQLPIEDLRDNEWIALQRSENVLRVVVGRQGSNAADGLRYIPFQEVEGGGAALVATAVGELLQELRGGGR